ncbi:MAG: sulfite exporter TauE/SafE family protein [Aestuariivirga sp.]
MLTAAATAIIFLAAIVRGYSGFGFSLLAITALSLIYPPAQVIPSIFMLEIAASIHLLPGLWRDIHWRSLVPLVIGTGIGMPIGLMFLTGVPAAPMQIALGLFVFVVTCLLWQGFALKTMPGNIVSTAAGLAAGVANGAFGIGGPPVILFYFASPAGNIVGRATLVTYFLLSDLVGLAFLSHENLVTSDTMLRTLMFLPALLAGVWLGARSFKNADPIIFRKWVLALLALLAMISAAKGLHGLWL